MATILTVPHKGVTVTAIDIDVIRITYSRNSVGACVILKIIFIRFIAIKIAFVMFISIAVRTFYPCIYHITKPMCIWVDCVN